jgi:hypothetical protein
MAPLRGCGVPVGAGGSLFFSLRKEEPPAQERAQISIKHCFIAIKYLLIIQKHGLIQPVQLLQLRLCTLNTTTDMT